MRKRKILSILFIIIWMIVIFWFSSMPSTESNGKSTKTINKVIKETVSVTNSVGVTDKNPSDSRINQLVEKVNRPLRKCMHACVYFILGLIVLYCLSIFKIKHRYILTVIICFLYACSDEFHQLYVVGRTGHFLDVIIDTFGTVLGLYLYYLFKRLSNRLILYIVFIISLILIPIICKLLFNDYGVIIGYIGSIIGGLITLEGVRLTIKHENDNRKNDLKYMYLPVLKAEAENGNNSYSKNSKLIRFVSNSDRYKDTDFYGYKKVIKLSNVGRGEILNLKVKLKDYELISSIDSNNHNLFVYNDNIIRLVGINDNVYLLPEIPIIITVNDKIHLNIKLNIEFEDIFKNKYYYELGFIIYVSRNSYTTDYSIFNVDLKLLNNL